LKTGTTITESTSTVTAINGLSQAAENNKDFILERLLDLFRREGVVLEIGSGTGQHAIHFATKLAHLTWQPTDQGEYLPLLKENLLPITLANMRQPLSLDVIDDQWPIANVDYVYSANTLHIMSSEHVEYFMRGVGTALKPEGLLVVYGPFKYGGEFTTDSNANFDSWLKNRDALSGIRDIESIKQLASDNGMSYLHDYKMPANNQLLAIQKL
jgi:cyclopropane fatty-acyl-phospholipid synthase-like methyltransferase